MVLKSNFPLTGKGTVILSLL